jgi:hypothetical protein
VWPSPADRRAVTVRQGIEIVIGAVLIVGFLIWAGNHQQAPGWANSFEQFMQNPVALTVLWLLACGLYIRVWLKRRRAVQVTPDAPGGEGTGAAAGPQ